MGLIMSVEMELLKKEDEEFQMLLEVCEEYSKQESGKTSRKKSGNATEIVIRNHLLNRGFNVTSKPDVKIQGSNTKNDMLLLRPNVNLIELKSYAPNDVDAVLEIKNNATPSQVNKKPVQPSIIIGEKFDELERNTGVNRFAVVVLSEKLLSKTPYKYAINEEKIMKENCRVFTLVARREYPRYPKYPRGGLSRKTVILKMLENHELWRTGEWEGLIGYLED